MFPGPLYDLASPMWSSCASVLGPSRMPPRLTGPACVHVRNVCTGQEKSAGHGPEESTYLGLPWARVVIADGLRRPTSSSVQDFLCPGHRCTGSAQDDPSQLSPQPQQCQARAPVGKAAPTPSCTSPPDNGWQVCMGLASVD